MPDPSSQAPNKMKHDPFKINEAILDLWRDLKAAEDDIDCLEIRNASLVKELDELRASSFVTAVPVEEYEKLKAEVERLTNENGNNSFMKEEWYLKCMSARAEVERLTEALKDEQAVAGHRADVIERLRKAGDAFEQALQDNPSTLYHIVQCVRAWNAAKEGKPSV